MPTTYALLVGIDAYTDPVPALRGCVADAQAVRDLIIARDSAASIRLLLDSEATHAAVTAAFVEQLGQAGPGDTAIFWYAGHGSQQPTASALGIEPDGWDETLVLVDSRTPDGADLCDKELAGLISRVAQRGAHLFVGLDCCHSGSGTREILPDGARVRRAAADRRVRAADTFPVVDPPGRHVLLAACRSDQTAKEVPVAGAQRGALTMAFEQALRAGAETYRDVRRAVRAVIDREGIDQAPQLEVTDDADALASVWGAGAVTRSPHYLLTFDGNHWRVDAGAVQGVPAGTVFDVFALDAPDLTDRSSALGTARVTEVGPAVATVQPDFPADTGVGYRAVVASWPLPRVPVTVEGALEDVRAALAASQFVVEGSGADLIVRAVAGGVDVIDATRGADPVSRLPGPAAGVVAGLEQIARWRQVAALANPGSSITTATVRIEVADADGNPLSDDEVVLPYGPGGPRTFRLTVRNTGDRTLYCALLGLSESYAVGTLLPGNVAMLAPGQLVTTPPIQAAVPDALWRTGVSRRTDLVVLLASTAEFDPGVLAQRGLPDPVLPAVTRGDPPRTTLDRLLRRVQQRELLVVGRPDESADWATARVRVVSERPQPGVPVAGTGVVLAPGVTLDAPAGLTAVASLTGTELVARDLVAPLVPPMLLDDPQPWAPLSLLPTRDVGTQLDVLELRDVIGAEAVSPGQPLVLRLDAELAADESGLVIGYDGVNYLVVGHAVREASGTAVRIEQLPPAVTTRSLGSSVRLLFRRFLHKALREDGYVTRLAIATLDAEDRVQYEDDPTQVAAAVARATRILLLVHGILGDTAGMVRGAVGRFGASYELTLAFDYENINTPVRDTSLQLKAKLLAAGVGNGKKVDVVAHSMGGLVSRWLIEQDDAAGLVGHLITAGTPNGGSPWPVIQDWATVALTFGLNQLASVFWPARIASGLVRLIEKVDVALDDMAPDSQPLQQLFGSPDPKLPYTVLVGNRSLIGDVPPTGRVAAILHTLKRRSIDAGVGLAFLGAPNDLAVAVTSATHLPAGRDPAPDLHTVACDHITFFSSEAGLAALGSAVVAASAG